MSSPGKEKRQFTKQVDDILEKSNMFDDSFI